MDVKKSAFRGDVKATRNAIRDWKNGKSIGFSREQSLKSMGLIPRKHGDYKLGVKYREP